MDSSLILESYCYESGDLSNAFDTTNAGAEKIKYRSTENLLGSKIETVKPIMLKIYSAFAMVAFLGACKPAPHTNNASHSQQLASESASALNAKDYVKAQTFAEKATDIDPQFAEAWVGYGMASVRLGQTGPARQAYERALSLHQARQRQNPSDANQVFQQIFLLVLLGRSAEAEKLLTQARIDYPNNEQISKLAGNFAVMKQEWVSWSVEVK